MDVKGKVLEIINRAVVLNSTKIDLSWLNLQEIPDELWSLKLLEEIDLSHNSLYFIPDGILFLPNLRFVNLSYNCLNHINGLPFHVGECQLLLDLDLSFNLFHDLPKEILWLREECEICFEGNPFMDRIPLLVIEDGLWAIIEYLESYEEYSDTQGVFETKLIVVGRGDVGKTTLINTLTDPEFEVKIGTEPTTHGIEIHEWELDLEMLYSQNTFDPFSDWKDKNVELFVDEEILFDLLDNYYSESFDNFFWNDDDSRYEENNESDEDDVQGVAHEVDGGKDGNQEAHSSTLEDLGIRKLTMEEREYLEEMRPYDKEEVVYAIRRKVRLNIWDFGGQEVYYATHQLFLTAKTLYLFVWEARKGESENDFEYWLSTISRLSGRSPIIVVMNKSDVRIHNIDEAQLRNNFPSIWSFIRVSCVSRNGIGALLSSIREALVAMPHLGFRISIRWWELRNDIASKGVPYLTLDEYFNVARRFSIVQKSAIQCGAILHDLGVFLHYHDDEILRNIVIIDPEWGTRAIYSIIDDYKIQSEFGFFAFDQLEDILPRTTYPSHMHIMIIRLMERFDLCFNVIGTKRFLIPELLPAEKPDNEDGFEIENAIRFQLTFQIVMPSGLIGKLMCRKYDLIYNNIFWRNGVIFWFEDAFAQIIQDDRNNRLSIKVFGENKTALLAIIRLEVKEILRLQKFEYGKDYKESVACYCSKCIDDDLPKVFPYEFLLDIRKKNVKTIYCEKSFEPVLVESLLEGIELERVRMGLFQSLKRAASQLQGKYMSVDSAENSRNDFITALISVSSNLMAMDQSRWGRSATGKSAGSLDIRIEDKDGTPQGIFEGFNLTGLHKNIIEAHINKIFGYDSLGLAENFVMIYVTTADFFALWEGYVEFVPTIKTFHPIKGEFIDISDRHSLGSEMRIGKTNYLRNNQDVTLYHFFLNIPEKIFI